MAAKNLFLQLEMHPNRLPRDSICGRSIQHWNESRTCFTSYEMAAFS